VRTTSLKISGFSSGARPFEIVAALILLVTGFAKAAPLSVAASADRVVVQGIRPGGSIALLSVAHESGYYMTKIVSRRDVLTDNNRSGRIEYVPDSGVAFRSIWVVVDLETGELAVASRAGFQPVQMSDPSDGRGPAVAVGPTEFDIGHDQADILVVRPGKGAWTIGLRERGTDDLPAAAPGRIHASLTKFRPIKKEFGSAPPAFIPGDVVVVLDPEQMEYWVTRVGR
jgi:hypothetical protein